METNLLSSYLPFLEPFMKSLRVRDVSSYLASRIKQLPNIRPGLPNLVKRLTVDYLSPNGPRIREVQDSKTYFQISSVDVLAV